MEESDSESEHLVLTRRRRGRDGGGGDVGDGGGGGSGVGKKINGLVEAEKDVVVKSRAADKSDLPPAVYSRKKPKVEDFDRRSGGSSRKGVGRKIRKDAAVNGKRLREEFDASDSMSGSGDEKLIRNSIDDKKLSKLKGGHQRLHADGLGSASFGRNAMKAENGEVGIRVQGKGGVLKLIPNKRMKLDVYEQSRGMKESEEGRRLLLSDSRRNALVSMGKKMSDRPLQTSHAKLANKMGRKRDYESLDDDSSTSGTESGSISDDHGKDVDKRKKNSNGPASILGKGKKDYSAVSHLDEKKKNSFWKGGLKGTQKNSVAAENNYSNRISKLDRKIKPAKVDLDDLYSSYESGGAELVRKQRNSLSEVTSAGKKKKEMSSIRRTDKQSLRDQIKKMLIEAGWTIELRPRSGRNCLDSVYISPSKSAFWSITNAYHALEKQFDSRWNQVDGSDNHKSKSFSRIPADVLSILTRRTNSKKVKEERAKKKFERVGGGKNVNKIKPESVKLVKLNSSAKQKGKSKDKVLGNSKHGRLESVSLSDESNDSRQGKSASISSKKADKTIKAPKAFADSEVQGKQNVTKKRYALLTRSSNKDGNSDANESSRYSGKLTVLSWLIDSGTVPENDKVQYMNKRRAKALLDGWITRDGIHCSCCSKILSVSKFEIHAGSKLRQPFQNIYLESGVSLLQCQVEAWNLQKDSDREEFHHVETSGDDPNDDACVICGDGGNLICCDGCPSTFHQGCLNVKVLPQGDWHCPNCSCKFCGIKDLKDDALYTCSQCERKCHKKCSGETYVSPNHAFCGKSCKKLFENLQRLIGTKKDLEGGYSCSLLCRVANDSEGLSRGQSQMIEWNSKLAVALALMDECFLPIVDRRSGVNMIHNVVYNCRSNFSRLNYSGFYTVILERGDEMISAASIRIHGTGLAEMPFIGTRHIYRRQGMCRRLLNAIESVLFSLDIEKLVIPAISELMHTWTEVFGFKPIDDSDKQEMKSMSLIVFPSTDMLQKLLLECTRAVTGRPDAPDGHNCCDMSAEMGETSASLSVKPAAHALKDDVVERDVDSDKVRLIADGVSLESNSNCDIHAEFNDPSASFSAELEPSAAKDSVVDHDVDGEKGVCTAEEFCQNGDTCSKISSLSIHVLPGSDVIDDSVSPARSTTSGTVTHYANSAVNVDCQTSAGTVPHSVNSAVDVDCRTSAENTVISER